MIQVSLLKPDDPRWQELLAVTRHDFYHLPAYVAAAARLADGRASAILAEKHGCAILAPIIERDLPGRFDGLWDATSPYGYANPLFRGAEDQRADFEVDAGSAVVDHLRELGCVSLFFRSHPLIAGMLRPPDAVTVVHGKTVYTDLSRQLPEIWSQTRAGHRADIRRAQRAGFEIDIERGPKNLIDFGIMYLETMNRLGASEKYLFDATYFTDLVQALGSSLIVARVRSEGHLAAAGLFVETCGIVEYHLSASSDQYRKYAPTKMILHEVQTWAAGEGQELLHLGGGVGGATDHLFQFKTGFSDRLATFATTRVVVDRSCYDNATLELLGNDAENAEEGFFPRYRGRADLVSEYGRV